MTKHFGIGRHAIVGSTLALILGASVAGAQNAPLRPIQPETINSGPLQSPKPYGDRGTVGSIGNPPIQYPDPRAPRPDPYTYWKNRIISTGGYPGSTVIIVNSSPCYVPWYYGYGFGGQYYDSSSYARLRIGGLQLGYQQSNYSQYGYQSNPTIGTYVPSQGVDFGGSSYLQELARANQIWREEARQRRAEERRPIRQNEQEADNGYYLHRKPKPKTPLDNDPALAEAVQDLENAFRTNNPGLLEKHLNVSEQLTLQARGRSRTPLSAANYLLMTREAMKEMKTVRYDLDKIEPASGGAWLVYGTHILRTEDGKDKQFNVAFVLKKRGEAWMVAEVSADVTR